MADLFLKTVSSLYTILAVAILSLWSILILSLLGASALQNAAIDRYAIITMIALPSLLTFLICKAIMAVHPDLPHNGQPTGAKNKDLKRFQRQNAGSLVRWIATAGDDSPQGAVALLLLSATWLFHMVRALASLLLLTAGLVGWIVALSVDEPTVEVVSAHTENSTEASPELLATKKNLTAALHEIKNDIGIDFESLMNRVPLQVLVALAISYWLLAFGLTGYIIAQAISAFKKIAKSPREAWVGVKEEDTWIEDKKTVEVASDVI